MQIVTWNVNSIRSRLELVLKWLDTHEPEVVLLQETKCEDGVFPREFFEDRGYTVATYGQKTYNGVAILSKYAIEDVTTGFPNFKDDPQCRYIEGIVNGRVRVASIYVPNGSEKGSPKFEYKMTFLEKMREYLPERIFADEAFIVGGDFNIAPTPQDVNNQDRWEGDVMCTTMEREHFQQLLNAGFVDVIRKLYPYDKADAPSLMTWWDYRKGSWHKDDGLRIDHLLISKNNAGIVLEGGIYRDTRGLEKPSDHAPVWCKVRP